MWKIAQSHSCSHRALRSGKLIYQQLITQNKWGFVTVLHGSCSTSGMQWLHHFNVEIGCRTVKKAQEPTHSDQILRHEVPRPSHGCVCAHREPGLHSSHRQDLFLLTKCWKEKIATAMKWENSLKYTKIEGKSSYIPALFLSRAEWPGEQYKKNHSGMLTCVPKVLWYPRRTFKKYWVYFYLYCFSSVIMFLVAHQIIWLARYSQSICN